MRHTVLVPKLWNDTIEAHRSAVREATLDTTAALVAEHGLASVTMSQIAKQTGIGRATLQKLLSQGDSVVAVDLNTSTLDPATPNLTIIEGDAADVNVIEAACSAAVASNSRAEAAISVAELVT